MNLLPILDQLEAAAAEGLGKLAETLSAVAGQQTQPVPSYLLQQVAALVETHGVDAVGLARERFEDLLMGKHLNPEAIRALPLHERGPLLAAALRQDIDAREQADAFAVAVGATLRGVLAGLIRG